MVLEEAPARRRRPNVCGKMQRRERIFAQLGVANNLGIDENFAAAGQANWEKTGQIAGGEADGEGADMAPSADFMEGANAPPRRPIGEAEERSEIFLLQTAVTH
jgi:hypothetical protein